jgi:hypothetical protein
MYSEVRKIFPIFSKEALLVLFETHCPSISVPILWCKTDKFEPLFINENGNLDEPRIENSQEEDRRTRVYHANTKLSQALNKYIVNHLKLKAEENNIQDWFHSNFIPKLVMNEVSAKWISEDTSSPKEIYFNFLDYKKIIEKNNELVTTFNISGENLSWCDKLNKLRRDPAHPEKPAPTEEEAMYFEKITNIILSRIDI